MKKAPSLRWRTLYVGFALGFLWLVVRAVQVQIVQGRRYEDIARAGRTREVELPARRGAIRDRNGQALSVTQNEYRVEVTTPELTDLDESVALLANQLGLSERSVRRELRRTYAEFKGPFSASQVGRLREREGIYPMLELRRLRPRGGLARVLVGAPGTDGVDASGLERVLDTLLTGTEGRAVVLRDQFGREFESPGRPNEFPVPGHDVYLTIDADLQDLVEQALVDAIDRYEAIGGDVVVMNPETGEILAVASRSGDTATAGAFTSVFQPGSTAKLFTAAALIEQQVVDLSDSVWTELGEYRIGSRVLRDEHEDGWLDLAGVIRRSSNIGMAKFVTRLTPGQQFRKLRDFGFGAPTAVEFPTESTGLLYPPREWSGASAVSLAIGYEFAVTMIQLTQAFAAVANDGVMVRPTLIHRVVSPAGREVYRHAPEPVRRVVTADIAATLRSMLRAVVEEGGTGAPAALVGMEVAGKTGTARRVDANGRYIPGSYTTSFVAMVPAKDPQLVFAVKLDDPEGMYSTATAVPLTRVMLEQLRAANILSLDRNRIETHADAAAPVTLVREGTVPYVSDWPIVPTPADTTAREVPDVSGLSIRDASRALHERGFRVRVERWGTVRSVRPAPGTTRAPGTLITIVGGARR